MAVTPGLNRTFGSATDAGLLHETGVFVKAFVLNRFYVGRCRRRPPGGRQITTEGHRMASVNKVILVGNLGRDPEVRYSPDGAAICNLSLATTSQWKDKTSGERREETEWHRVVMYNRLAEIAGEYLKKGRSVYIEGRLKTRKWQDKDTGADRYSTEIVADQMQMLGGRDGGDGGNYGGGGGGYDEAPRQQRAAASVRPLPSARPRPRPWAAARPTSRTWTTIFRSDSEKAHSQERAQAVGLGSYCLQSADQAGGNLAQPGAQSGLDWRRHCAPECAQEANYCLFGAPAVGLCDGGRMESEYCWALSGQ